jgi:hypothetical protein
MILIIYYAQMHLAMKKNDLIFVFLIIIVGHSCSMKYEDISDGSIIAYSLKEAQILLSEQASISDSSIYTLGGIHRLVGLVIDRENKDIILIGKKSNQLPSATLDHFVVALRSRFVHDELPMVSIDPVENTAISRKQKVRFGGKIQNTSFGRVFLDCDILLKEYSFGLERVINQVPSYKKHVIDQEYKQLKKKNIIITKLNWIDKDSIAGYSGSNMESEVINQTRFWFNYKDPYRVRIRGDVFCIMSLDITVEKEVLSIDNYNVYPKNDEGIYNPDEFFAKTFSEHYYLLSKTYPVLMNLKLLFDMTAIAEGMKQTENLPDIDYLLYDYQPDFIKTDIEYDLIDKTAVIERSDGKISLINLSGGLSTSVELEWLNGGDISYLKHFVLESRPNEKSLYWKVPIDEWEMPNSDGIVNKSAIIAENPGFYIQSSSVILNPLSKNGIEFMKFSSIEPIEPINTKGVQMKMIIDEGSFEENKNLIKLRDKILNDNK